MTLAPAATAGVLRVVHLDHTAELSGAEIALASILPELQRRDVHSLVVLGADGPLAERLGRHDIETRVLPLDPAVRTVRRGGLAGLARAALDLRLARYVLAVRDLLIAERVDVVHANSLKAALYGGVAGRLAGVPVVWHVRDRYSREYLGPVAPLVRLLVRTLPTAVVANSAFTLREALPVRGKARARARVVLDGVPAPHADRVPVGPAEPASPDAADTDSVAGDVVRVGLVGRLSPWKGQDLFLRAFARATAGTSARAVVVGSAMFGDDAWADGLVDLAAGLGIADRVEFRGFRTDVGAELARLDLLVHCSTSPEPFGQVVVEGMAAGLAVIAAGEGGPAEIVTDGRDGLLVPPRNEVALAAAIARCLADPSLRARLGAAARIRAADFGVGQAVEALAAALRAAAGQPSLVG